MAKKTLIHDVFKPTSVVQTELQAQLLKSGYKLDQFQWIGSKKAPDYTKNPELAVILYVTLETIGKTLDFYWDWAKSHHRNPCREHYVHTHKARLYQHTFQPNTIQWVCVELNAHFGAQPTDVRGTENDLAGPEVLAVYAEHPERARKSDGTRQRPQLWMVGVEIDYGEGTPVPLIWYRADDEQFQLNLCWGGSTAEPDTAVPRIVQR